MTKPAAKTAPTKTAKSADVADLLGGKTKPAAKAAAAPKAEAKPATAAKTPAVKAEKVARAPKEKVVFAEGERDELAKKVKKAVRAPINSKDLATKLEIPTRKLRQVLYSMSRAGTIATALSASRAAGMTVSPVAAV